MAKGDICRYRRRRTEPQQVGTARAVRRCAVPAFSLDARRLKAALANCGQATSAAAIDTIAGRAHSSKTRSLSVRWPRRAPSAATMNLPGHARPRTLRPSLPASSIESVGGQSPQAPFKRNAGPNPCWRVEVALISGSEANRASKGAPAATVSEINWADDDAAPFEDRAMGPDAAQPRRDQARPDRRAAYFLRPVFENAIAARPKAATRSQHRRADGGKTVQPFLPSLAKNPFSQFPWNTVSTSSPRLSRRGKLRICRPVLKWFIAQDAVNQGAAASS